MISNVYFWCGSTAMPRGFTSCVEITIARTEELSKDTTSIVSLVESVQYKWREIQSTATPSGERISEIHWYDVKINSQTSKNASDVFFIRSYTFLNENFLVGSVILRAENLSRRNIAPINTTLRTILIDTNYHLKFF